jgi:ABC-type transport system involved in multi-copper enzyme maturation permease subunit
LSPATEIRLIAAREIRRSVRSVKGIVLAILTLLGAFVTSLVCVWFEGSLRVRDNAASTEAYTQLRQATLEKATGDPAFAAYAAAIPTSLLVFLKVTVGFAPLLIALLGFDLMSSELQHRSVRFWTVRTRRWSYFTGKMLGLWAVVALMMLALNVMAGIVAAARGFVTPVQLFTWGFRFWLVAVVIAGSWAAIATIISSCFRTPMLSLLTTFLAFFVMWVVGTIGFFARLREALETGVQKNMTWYEYFYPNAYDTLLLSPETTKVLTALGVLVGFVVLANAAGAALFQQRDV